MQFLKVRLGSTGIYSRFTAQFSYWCRKVSWVNGLPAVSVTAFWNGIQKQKQKPDQWKANNSGIAAKVIQWLDLACEKGWWTIFVPITASDFDSHEMFSKWMATVASHVVLVCLYKLMQIIICGWGKTEVNIVR